MALIKCCKCGKQVSSKAKKCPHCGNIINSKNNENLMTGIVAIGIILFIVFIITSIGNSVKKDAEARKQTQLREFESQMRQDPTTWDKEQRDRYDSFTKWDMQNER